MAIEMPVLERNAPKNRFERQCLSEEEKETLGVSNYYRPHRVDIKTALKDKRGYWHRKRVIDFFLAAIALIVLAPFMLLFMILIFIEDPHSSPIFVQERVGYKGRVFRFYKLRSMYTGAERRLEDLLAQNEFQGKAFKIKDDPRITKIGRLIRNTSIDELPQLVNILKGDMCVVGPRPPMPREVATYDEYEKQRLLVTPGLTCFWQTHPRRHEISFDDWVALDIKYIEERSFLLDAKLVLRTIRYILKGNAD